MNEAAEHTADQNDPSTEAKKSSAGWKIRVGVLCAMLALALVGMGLTQASDSGVWEFWLFVILIYAGLGIWRKSQSAKQAGHSFSQGLIREISHWGTLVGFLAVLLMLERNEIVNRESASYFALMMLALTCCLAGIHGDWLLMVVGIVLTIMLVSMAMLEQMTVMLWLIMIVVVGLAAAFFYFQSKSGDAKS